MGQCKGCVTKSKETTCNNMHREQLRSSTAQVSAFPNGSQQLQTNIILTAIATSNRPEMCCYVQKCRPATVIVVRILGQAVADLLYAATDKDLLSSGFLRLLMIWLQLVLVEVSHLEQRLVTLQGAVCL